MYSAYYESLISRHSGMARVNKGSHHPPATHTCIHKWNEPYLPLTASRKIVAALWLVLISRPAGGRRLSWPGRLGLGIHIPIRLRVEDRRELTEAEPWTVDSNVLFSFERVGTQQTLLHSVSKKTHPTFGLL